MFNVILLSFHYQENLEELNMFKNGMRPIHPGEILREDYLVPLEMSINALA